MIVDIDFGEPGDFRQLELRYGPSIRAINQKCINAVEMTAKSNIHTQLDRAMG